MNVNEIKQLKEANDSLSESVKASLKTFKMSWNDLQNEYNILRDTSVKTTLQLFHVLNLSSNFDNKDKIRKYYITLNKRQGEFELDKCFYHYLLLDLFISFDLKNQATSNW